MSGGTINQTFTAALLPAFVVALLIPAYLPGGPPMAPPNHSPTFQTMWFAARRLAHTSPKEVDTANHLALTWPRRTKAPLLSPGGLPRDDRSIHPPTGCNDSEESTDCQTSDCR